MKKIILALAALLTAITLIAPCRISASNEDRVVDMALLLSTEEEKRLEQELRTISEKYSIEIVVLTTRDTEGKDCWDYACDFYDYNGYGYGEDADGIMLIVDMQSRMFEIISTGKGISVLTDSKRDAIEDKLERYLSNGQYYDAFHIFATQCENYIDYYNYANYVPQKDLASSEFWTYTLRRVGPISAVVAAVAALITVVILAIRNKSVSKKGTAYNYSLPGSFKLRGYSDVYLYRNVTRRLIPKDNGGGGGSGHTTTSHSSSGRSHSSGGGRHF